MPAQVAFKGYEEARVALTCLLFTIPCCIIIGVEYGVFMNGGLKKVSRHSIYCSWGCLELALCSAAILCAQYGLILACIVKLCTNTICALMPMH
jgi:hypothetical protein